MAGKETIEQQADRLFKYLIEYLKEWARPPAQREMRAAVGCSNVRLQKLLKLLQTQGRAIYIMHRRRQVWPVKGGNRRGTTGPSARLDQAGPASTAESLQAASGDH